MRVLTGLLVESRQTTDLTEPHDPIGTLPRACADTFADRLLQQHPPLREASLQRKGIAQVPRDLSPQGPVTGGMTEGLALVEHPHGVLQVPLSEA